MSCQNMIGLKVKPEIMMGGRGTSGRENRVIARIYNNSHNLHEWRESKLDS